MMNITRMGQGPVFARAAAALLLGTALSVLPLAAQAQDSTETPAATEAPAEAPADAPAAEAPAAEAPAADAPAAGTEVSPMDVVATVGDETITEADLAFAAEDLQDNLAQVPPQERRAFLVSVLVDMKIMAKAARDAGMDQTELFKRRVQYMEDSALRRSFFAEKIADGINEATLQAAYDKFVADFEPVEEVHARHILVETEEEAKQVEADLESGKPFEMVAMEKTIDPSGKQTGGDLGFFSKGMMVPAFEEVAFTLEPGEVSAPVESQFGWHIIKLEEKRMTTPPPIEQLAPQLGQQAMYDAYDATITGLRDSTEISIPDAELAAGVKRQTEGEAAPAN
ncbi:peptidylprolyl isomerase [Devosia sp.]|uniref:peptidylprolyl isomerase n=1 Tax=Devosia sp. TaxID=1871048 RepID=UPI003A92ECB7